VSAAVLTAAAQQPGRGRGAPAAPLPDNTQSLARIEAARKRAGNDPWLQAPFNFYCVAGNARANNGQAPVREPVKLFDNLYAVGSEEATVYAITTSQGIVLIDADSAARVETSVVGGLKTRRGGDPHPFQVTTDRCATFWGIISECIQAEIARRPAWRPLNAASIGTPGTSFQRRRGWPLPAA
jgi:hypothetical protein